MADAIVEVHLDDTVYRLNTNTQLKIVSKKVKPKPKVLRIVNQAVFKEHPDKRKGSPLPEEYIQYDGKEAETDEDEVEYDLDDEDFVWLELINQRRASEGLGPIDEKQLERGIDRFEKASYFQNTDASKATAIDNDAVCCICEDGDDSNVNQIIFCDMCNIAVHQECYGVPYIPAGQWLCRRCQLSPSELVRCVFCPYTNGAFKQTSDNRWAHVKCALWLNEVHFANAVFLEPVEGVAFSLKRRAKLRCLVCKIKMGACLQCSKKSCVRPFHVTCAMYSGMQMKVETQEKDGSEDTIVNRYAFCHQHSAINLKTMPPTQAAFKRQVQENIKRARKVLQDSSRQSIQVAIPVISSKKLDEIREELDIEQLEDVLNYWSLKRRARCGVPLIRRLQVYHSRKQLGHHSADSLPTDENAAGGLLSIPGVEKGVAGQLYRTGMLRNNLEKLRLLIELTKKREKYKLEMVTNFRNIVEAAMKPPSEILEATLEKLIAKDQHKVFAKPVNEADVPGYHKIIKKPMDFGRMKSRLRNGEYKRVADMRADYELMMDNCAHFNKSNPFYWRYGHQMRAMGQKIMKTAEQEEQSLTSNKLLNELIPVLFGEQPESADIQLFADVVMREAEIDEKEAVQKKRKISTASTNRRSSLATPSGLRETKILDFFKPVNTPPVGASTPADALDSPASPPASKRRKMSASSRGAPSTSSALPPGEGAAALSEYLTEDESDTPDATTSADEDFSSRVRNRKQRKAAAPPKAEKAGTKRKAKNRTSPRLSLIDPRQADLFSHDDLVWAPFKTDKLPARVFDRLQTALEFDAKVANQIKKLSADNRADQTLVVFFDADKSVRYVPTRELEHCDVRTKLSGDHSTVAAALRRAKDYWDRYCAIDK
ncbi:hypothetical protein M3Y99_01377200 [Aphelenchoides fujianensis]|nr:hypothetical protein M3Y99_01377200 [Aphelenchoides fujianensis]